MGRILYTTHDRESVLQDGVIFGKVNYNNRQKGLAERWPLIYAQVVYGGAPCCRQHGDEVELTADVFQRVAAEWHICVPEVDASCTRGGDITVTLYLIPDNHSGIQYPGYPDYDVVDMGMSHIHASVNASQLVDELVDRVGYLAYGDHLHVVILADSLRLRPAAGQPGSCRCGQIASPACDHGQCSHCCRGCSRHAAPVAINSSSNAYYQAQQQHTYQPLLPPPPPLQVQQQQVFCACGRPAASACRGVQCATCCHDYSCRRHWDPPDDSSTSSSSEDTHLPTQQLCSCGQPAATACGGLKCARCCCDYLTCMRHWPQTAVPAPQMVQQVLHNVTTGVQHTRAEQFTDGIRPIVADVSSAQQTPRVAAAAVPSPPPAATAAAAGTASTGPSSSAPVQPSSSTAAAGGSSRSPEAPRVAFGGFRASVIPASSSSPPPPPAAAGSPSAQTAAVTHEASVLVSPPSAASLPPGRTVRRYRVPSPAPATPAPAVGAGTPAAGAATNASSSGRSGSRTIPTASPPPLVMQLERLSLFDAAPPASSAIPAAASDSSSTRATSARPASGNRQQRYEQLLHQLTEFMCSNPQQQEVLQPMMELLDLAYDISTPDTAQQGIQQCSSDAAVGASCSGTAAAANGVWGDSRSTGQGITAAEQLHQLQSCIVCLDAPRSVVLLPCKHLVLCATCSRQLQHHASRDDPPGTYRRTCALCPVCREPAKQHMGGIIMA